LYNGILERNREKRNVLESTNAYQDPASGAVKGSRKLTEEKILILASNSPRRKQLLALGGYEFKIAAAHVDETPLAMEKARPYVLRLAETKARAVASQMDVDCIIIGADTTVVDQNEQGIEEILGKPESEQEAANMLTRLRSRTHQVLTAVAILDSRSGMLHSEVCSTDVTMRDYTDEEMRVYIESCDPMDKAGAYAIQHAGFNPVKSLTGCYPNVVGLPLCSVARVLETFGIPRKSDITSHCQENLQTPCRVYTQSLQGAK
jgi:septum formation protein